MGKKSIVKILIILIFFLTITTGKTYGTVGTGINKSLTKWTSLSVGMEKEEKQQMVDEFLEKLRQDFQYEGDTINYEMRMLTQISIVKKTQTLISQLPWLEDEYTYTVRIRNRK